MRTVLGPRQRCPAVWQEHRAGIVMHTGAQTLSFGPGGILHTWVRLLCRVCGEMNSNAPFRAVRA